MKILFLESFFGGSHRDFAIGFKEHSEHRVDLLTLPARFWKWRMRGASVFFLSKIKDFSQYDAIFATDMMDLTDLIGLRAKNLPPILFYFHENQIDYPLSPGEKRDFHMGFTNIISAAAADKVLFNSSYHLESFMSSARRLMGKLPDYAPVELLENIRNKAEAAYPGCRFKSGKIFLKTVCEKPPLILWNHRWEHDKNPEAFYDLLVRLKNENLDFSLAVVGENFSTHPPVFEKIREEFKDRIQVWGFVESRQAYQSWLEKADIVVSCANQENFGISVVEAIRFGCLPLLPKRLSYPELIPEEFHQQVVYETHEDAAAKLIDMIKGFSGFRMVAEKLSKNMERFSWDIRVKQYDNILKKLKKFP